MVAMNFSCFGTLFLFYVNMWIYLVTPFFYMQNSWKPGNVWICRFHIGPRSCIWVCLKNVVYPIVPNGFCWSLSLLNGYFIGKINSTFSDTPISGKSKDHPTGIAPFGNPFTHNDSTNTLHWTLRCAEGEKPRGERNRASKGAVRPGALIALGALQQWRGRI